MKSHLNMAHPWKGDFPMLITLLSRKFTGVLSPCEEEVSVTQPHRLRSTRQRMVSVPLRGRGKCNSMVNRPFRIEAPEFPSPYGEEVSVTSPSTKQTANIIKIVSVPLRGRGKCNPDSGSISFSASNGSFRPLTGKR